jgi:hypothetical protein
MNSVNGAGPVCKSIAVNVKLQQRNSSKNDRKRNEGVSERGQNRMWEFFSRGGTHISALFMMLN